MDEVIDYLTNIPAWFLQPAKATSHVFARSASQLKTVASCGSALLPIKMSMFSWKRTLNSKHRVGILDSLGS